MRLTRYALVRDAINMSRSAVRMATPGGRAAEKAARLKRDETDRIFARLCAVGGTQFDGEVLVDGQWDNPNYWFRTSLLRAALGLPNGRETGLLGAFRARESARTMSILGIESNQRFDAIEVDARVIESEADHILSSTTCAEDVLDWRLPGGVPAALVYDGILKRQRLAMVDVARSDFRPLLVEALTIIERARMLFEAHDFRLVLISHTFGLTYGVLAHQALVRGIPVILPFGLFGVTRMSHMRRPEELTAFYDRPSGAEMNGLSPSRARAMAEVGRRYMESRLGGKADDLAAVYAFRRAGRGLDREGMCARFGWDPERPIVGFYASNWFDWPHQLGMTQFRDFLDWTEATFDAARDADGVNWLFKPHPCETWFGGVGLRDILVRMDAPANIGIAQSDWNNADVMKALDALVTYHGTAGIEFASLGKPVLVPDRGKYEEYGFVKVAEDRADYLRLLHERWWEDMDMVEAQRRAEIFAGWWFCAPQWQGEFLLADDSLQNALYDIIPRLVADHRAEVEREIIHLREWFASGHPYSHTYKMMHADSYRPTNVG